MRINDEQFEEAIKIARKGLLKSDADLDMDEKAAFVKLATGVLYDIRRIADALESFNYVKVGEIEIASTKPDHT